MNLGTKIKNPICIKLGKDSNIIMSDNNRTEDLSLTPGAMFRGEHYGFVLIADTNEGQKEKIYPTQHKIQAIGMGNGTLKVFETGKNFWLFNKSGKLKYSPSNDLIEESSGADIITENYDMFMGEPTIKNPIRIMIAKKPEESVILKDENIKEDYPLHPGVVLGSEHYGFILIRDTEEGQKCDIYPTQNRIDAVEITGYYEDDLKVYENGKKHPWIFTFKGALKQKSFYNRFSSSDKNYVEDCYILNKENSEDYFTITKKK